MSTTFETVRIRRIYCKVVQKHISTLLKKCMKKDKSNGTYAFTA